MKTYVESHLDQLDQLERSHECDEEQGISRSKQRSQQVAGWIMYNPSVASRRRSKIRAPGTMTVKVTTKPEINEISGEPCRRVYFDGRKTAFSLEWGFDTDLSPPRKMFCIGLLIHSRTFEPRRNSEIML